MTLPKLLWAALPLVLVANASPQELKMVPPRYGHQVFLPKKMWASHKKWPLILYLHGKSLRGSDLSRVSAYGLPKRLQTDKGFPFIVLAPQLPAGLRWTDTKALASLVTEAMRLYPVDQSRVYVMGYSMGASGVWRVAHDNPTMFAALISIAGSYEKPLAQSGRLKRVPVWVIHGTADKEASASDAKAFVELFRKHGGIGTFTPLIGRDHGLTDLFDDGRLYKWLLKFRRGRISNVNSL
ncbi:MAG: dienelactone hydrolase family protein [Fimbriimonas sp.]